MWFASFGLFLGCLVGQSLTGWIAHNGSLRAGHCHGVAYSAYPGTGSFLDGIVGNWQAAIPQLAVLIAFSSILRQKNE